MQDKDIALHRCLSFKYFKCSPSYNQRRFAKSVFLKNSFSEILHLLTAILGDSFRKYLGMSFHQNLLNT